MVADNDRRRRREILFIEIRDLDGRQKATLMSRAAAASLTALANEAADAIESARLWREARDNARIVEELRVAFQIQQALLPRPVRSASFFDAVAASVPCSEIGGDFFDYMDLAGNRFGIKIRNVNPTDVVKLEAPMKMLQTRGMPNFFGEQRFGLDL